MFVTYPGVVEGVWSVESKTDTHWRFKLGAFTMWLLFKAMRSDELTQGVSVHKGGKRSKDQALRHSQHLEAEEMRRN